MRTSTRTLGIAILSLSLPLGALAQDEGIVEGDTYDSGTGGAVWVEEGEPEGGEPDPELDTNYFFDKLAPYGEWIWTPEHGWVWRPSSVDQEWRPYTYGHWVYTDQGWTWSSSFDWGWAPFHYGSWAFLAHIGWVWVPGTVWSPARVIWRYSHGYVGWAPMLAGFDYWYGWAYYPVYYDHWTFIGWGHFCHRHPHHHYYSRRKVRDAFRHSSYPRRCRDRASAGCRRGPARKTVSRLTGSTIPQRRVQAVAPATRQMSPKAEKLGLQGDTLRVFRPKQDRPSLQKNPTRTATKPGLQMRDRRKTIDLGVVESSPRRVPSGLTRDPASALKPSTATTSSRRPERGATINPRRPQPKPAFGKRVPGNYRKHSPTGKVRTGNPARTHPKVYRPSPSRGSYKPGRSHKPSSSKGSYKPSRSYKPSKSRGSYKPSKSRGSYKPSKSRGSYKPSSSKGSYKPSSSKGSYKPSSSRSNSRSSKSYSRPSRSSGSKSSSRSSRRR